MPDGLQRDAWRDFLNPEDNILHGRQMTMRWHGFGLDFRRAVRGLTRSRAFTLTAVAVLTGTVAAGTAVFAYVQGTLLDRPPFEDPDRLVIAWGSEPTNGQLRDVISGSNFTDLRSRTTTVSLLAAFHLDDVTLLRDGQPVVLDALNVSVEFLSVLGVRPATGQDFSDDDRMSGGRRSVIVSHGFWNEQLGARTDVIGSTLTLDGNPVTIIGVLPAGFRFAGASALYLPLRDDELAAEERTHHHYHMVGRLRPGASAVLATSELSAVLADIAVSDPRLDRWRVLVEPLFDVTVEAVRPALWTLAAAVLLVFAVGIVNLGTLFRIRTLERSSEVAVRAALGASRRRIAALVAIEAMAIAAVGGCVGLAAAPLALDVLAALAPAQVLIPHSAASLPVLRATVDASLLIGAFAAALAAGLLVAAPSLLAALRISPSHAIGHAGSRVTQGAAARWLVGAELAMATLLAVGASLTWRSAQFLAGRDLGVSTEGVVTASFGNVAALDPDAKVTYYRRVLDAVRQVPGVRHAGLIDYRPFEGEDDFKGMRFPERPIPPRGQGVREEWRRISDGYVESADLRVLAGRSFASADFFGTPRSVLVNRAFAAKHYAGEDPVGRRLFIAERGYTDVEIIGVIGDVLERGPMSPAPPMVFVPFQAAPRDNAVLFVKPASMTPAFADAIRNAIWSVDPLQPVMDVKPLVNVVRQAMATPTMLMQIVGALAMLAMLLAALGVFGVVTFAVRARTREFGVRMALGATGGRLQRDVVAGFLPVALLAVALGAAMAAAGVGAVRSVLYGVAPGDPLAFAVAVIGVTAVAVVAAWVPALSIVRVDPSRVIRD